MKILSVIVLLTGLCLAQVAAPGSVPQQPSQRPAQMTPVPYGVSQALGQLNQTAQQTVNDLGKVRVEKWKTDDRTKDQSRSNVESLQRNLTAALPTLVQQVEANPSSLAPLVKLYRNLNAVYDVMAAVTESTGAFGSKDDFALLSSDAGNLDTVRRSIAEQLEQLAANQDAQMSRMMAQARAQQQAAAAAVATPKHIVVDDTDTAAKKAPAKKKAATKTPPKSQ
jgi:hypothetical protein